MYKIKLDPFYELELEQILISIVSDYTLDYAQKIAHQLDQTIIKLQTFPKMFAVYADVPLYRKFTIAHKYTVFYTVNDDEQIITIVHIFPSIRYLPNLLD